MSEATKPKVPVHLGYLRGPEGNTWVILGRVKQYMKAVGRSADYPAFEAEAKSGNYEHVLDTVLKWCDDLDGSITELRDGR